MHIRRPPSGDGPRIYRPNESVAVRLEPSPRPVAHEPDSIPPPPRDSLLARVNRRRGQILTVMVSIAAIASFGSVVWWAHNQDVRAGGKGLEPLVVQAPATPARTKPENAGGLVPPNQDKEVYNRIAPGKRPAGAGRAQARARGGQSSDPDPARGNAGQRHGSDAATRGYARDAAGQAADGDPGADAGTEL